MPFRGCRNTAETLCMRSKFSGKHLVRCYPCERQQAFLTVI
ncbi:conserved domain protein [delta proteobacterium NaphS2]|nr:conserved domain protein [delta proteobacterium NaphS2]